MKFSLGYQKRFLLIGAALLLYAGIIWMQAWSTLIVHGDLVHQLITEAVLLKFEVGLNESDLVTYPYAVLVPLYVLTLYDRKLFDHSRGLVLLLEERMHTDTLESVEEEVRIDL